MRILSIETSCDETAIAVVEATGGIKKPRFKVLENFISSQIKIHRPFGGVVPMLAKREHIKNLPKLLRRLGIRSDVRGQMSNVPTVTAIAVTVGPGLEPALWQGIEFGKRLAASLHKPIIGVNHMEGHVFSVLLDAKNSKVQSANSKASKRLALRATRLAFPAIGLVVSGGHTILVKMTSLTKWVKLGETRDDAAGEAFDKVGKMLGLPYPGGPEIQKISEKGNPKAIAFPRPMLNSGSASRSSASSNYDFSFSGLKTAVLYYLRDHKITFENKKKIRTSVSIRKSVAAADVAASFQQAVIDVLVKKTMQAARQYSARTVFLCGGVAANKPLREALDREAQIAGIPFLVPEFIYNTDNAVMIAAAAYLGKLTKRRYALTAQPNLTL